MSEAFHDISFPLSLALRSVGGPERLTDILPLKSGFEQRIQRWQHSKRRYNAGIGVKSRADLLKVLDFFEARQGRLYSFRFPDMVDYNSAPFGGDVFPHDQPLISIDESLVEFQLIKTYGSGAWQYTRPITKPRLDSVRIALNSLELSNSDFSVDHLTGIITLSEAISPDDTLTAGYSFDIPARFDSDQLMIDLVSFEAGQVPDIPIIEVFG